MTARKVKLNFDAARCDGYGMCSLLFPDHITLDPWGFAHVSDELVEDSLSVARAIRAARCCPRRALKVVEVKKNPVS